VGAPRDLQKDPGCPLLGLTQIPWVYFILLRVSSISSLWEGCRSVVHVIVHANNYYYSLQRVTLGLPAGDRPYFQKVP
jgi:hypothetical protein